MLNIIVCMKVIIDPETPLSIFKIDRENRNPVPPSGTPPVFSPFDENALESALKIKDKQECHITILSIGKSFPKAVLQKALAAGADAAIAIESPEFENLDPFNTANVLANAVKKIGKYDLIFTGRQAADWDAGLVWAGIAEFLDLPSVTIARKADVWLMKIKQMLDPNTVGDWTAYIPPAYPDYPREGDYVLPSYGKQENDIDGK